MTAATTLQKACTGFMSVAEVAKGLKALKKQHGDMEVYIVGHLGQDEEGDLPCILAYMSIGEALKRLGQLDPAKELICDTDDGHRNPVISVRLGLGSGTVPVACLYVDDMADC